MKRILVALLWLIVPALAVASGPSLDLGKGYSIALSTSLGDAYADVTRDYLNGMWLMGYGKEIAPAYHVDSVSGVKYEFAYIGFYNVFALGDGKGVFGLDLGIKLPTIVLNGVGWLTNQDIIKQLPPWGQKLQYVTSLEAGYGYRVFGISKEMTAQGIRKECWTVGAHINMPIDYIMANWFNHSGSL